MRTNSQATQNTQHPVVADSAPASNPARRAVRRMAVGCTVLATAGTLALTGCGSNNSGATSTASDGSSQIQTNPTTTTSDAGASGTATATATVTSSTGSNNGSNTGTGTATSTVTSTGTGTATSSTTSSHQGATPVTVNNLPPASTVHLYDFKVVSSGGGEGAGQSPLTLCQTMAWNMLKPNSEVTRTFTLRSPSGVDGYAGVTMAAFGSHDAAVKAAGSMYSSFQCRKGAEGVGGVIKGSVDVKNSTTTLNGGVTARRAVLSYDSKDVQDATNQEQVGVMVTGTHVALVSLNFSSQDADTEWIDRTMNAMLPYLAK